MNEFLMAKTVQIPASTKVPNILTGEQYERAPFNATCSLFLTGSGASTTELIAGLTVDGLSVAPEINISTENRIPLVPDDVAVASFFCPQGGLIHLSVTNNTAGALNAHYKVILAPYQG